MDLQLCHADGTEVLIVEEPSCLLKLLMVPIRILGRANCFRRWACEPSQVDHVIPGMWAGILEIMLSLISRITSTEDN